MNVTTLDGKVYQSADSPFASGVDGSAYWTNDGKYMVKLYHSPETWREESLKAILERFNVVRNDPYWESLLCWPIGIVKTPRLGIVVPRAKNMKKIANLVLPRWLKHHPEDIGNFSSRVLIAIRMARAVKRLHFKGLCHSDLSENNVLANSSDGSAYVIDIDGLVVPDLQIARPVVDGTKGYVAPELLMGKVKDPNVTTDLHALAVLIYQVLLLRHPLLGRKVNDKNNPDRDELLAFGANALFIEHPTDPSNRPNNLAWSYQLLGNGTSKMMERAFVDGLHHSNKRPLAADWERELVRMHDTLIPCFNPACTLKAFPLPALPNGRGTVQCPWCKQVMRGITIPVMYWYAPCPGQAGIYRPDGTWKVAWPGSTLHEWHIQPNTMPGPQFTPNPLAEVRQVQDKLGGARWYLINLNMPMFEASDAGNPWKRIPLNQAVELKAGRKLRFGLPGQARDVIVNMVQLV
jgi:DNA-binding helix-hairpin-helix protein with protein kinase domain